jgi:type I restriction enzyme, S subunit
MGVSLGFKRSDAGVVPIDWTVSRLGELGKCSSGTTPLRVLYERYFRNGSTPWVKTLDLTNGLIISTSENVTDVALKETSLKVYPVGTVLVAMYGGFQQIGRTGLLRIPAAVNQALTAIQVDDSRLASEFLLATLNYRIEYWKMVASSSRKDPNITGSDIRRFPIAYPSYARQRAVATALGDVDALLDGLDRLIAKKRDLKQAAMQQLLTGQTRLPGFGGEWEEVTLFDIAERKKELFDDGDWIESEHITSNGVRLIQTGNIGVGCYVEKEEKKFIFEASFQSLGCKLLQLGDLLICRLADPAGRACVLPEIGYERIVTSVDVTIFRPKAERADRGFLQYVFSTPEWFRAVSDRSGGTTHKRISRGALGRIIVRLPSLHEQAAIAKILVDMDAELTALEARRNKTRALKQAMMQELLTGRIRLVDPAQKAELHT